MSVQAAHVGIGISGVEGLQASCASDYSIAQVNWCKVVLLSVLLLADCCIVQIMFYSLCLLLYKCYIHYTDKY